MKKICNLLVLGIGESGKELISHYVLRDTTGSLSRSLKGKTINAIFGFCDIRNFTETTEILQSQILE